MKRRICGTVAFVVCLAIPAGAVAHPSVYTVTAKVAPAGVTNPTEGQLTDQLRYFMNNDGWAYALRETNGNTTMAPSTTRCCQALSAVAHKGAVAGAEYVTGLQPHATCDVAALHSKADDPLMAERSLLGLRAVAEDVREPGRRPGEVDPRRQDGHGGRPSTVSDFAAACAAIGGTYVKADEVQTSAASLVGEYVASIVDPIEAKVAELEAAVAKASTDAATADATAGAEIARLTAANRVLALTAPASLKRGALKRGGVTLALDGPPSTKVRVTLRMSDFKARKIGLKSGYLGSAVGTIGAEYNLGVTLKPTKKAGKKLKKAKAKTIRATLEATGGDRFARKTIKLVK